MSFSQFNQDITGLRFSAGTTVKGRYTAGSTTPLNFKGSVQPVTGNNIQQLPEGRKNFEAYFIYTKTELFVDNPTAQTSADEVTLFGKAFEVIKVENWQNKVIPHYKITVSLKKRA
jgi:hypothetical protein